jgi:queuine tRNA-ribosyltransferase
LEKFSFQILAEDGQARTGRIRTPHGPIETPAFVPVATQGAVRPLSAADLSSLGAQVLITNAYHLHLHPGEAVIQQMGGLHRFMGWSGPVIMDSGGFQVFSLGMAKEQGGGKLASPSVGPPLQGKHRSPSKGKSLVRVTEEGAEFISYRDGSRHLFTPEEVVNTGRNLGVDIIMVLDECTSPSHDYRETLEAMERTHRWAGKALSQFQNHPSSGQALFGIVQGGAYQELRERSARFIGRQDFDGYALGGFLGNSKEDLARILKWTIPHLPQNKPRHFLGIGMVEDIFEMVRQGIDLFDCIAPTRMAGTGTFLTREDRRFRIRILNETFRQDPRPVEQDCSCYTCRNHSRAYLRHLFSVKEPLAAVLAALHNLHFMESLMQQIRTAVRKGEFEALVRNWAGTK